MLKVVIWNQEQSESHYQVIKSVSHSVLVSFSWVLSVLRNLILFHVGPVAAEFPTWIYLQAGELLSMIVMIEITITDLDKWIKYSLYTNKLAQDSQAVHVRKWQSVKRTIVLQG